MTRDYMDRCAQLRIMDDYLRQTIAVAGEYMADVRRAKAVELFCTVDLSDVRHAYEIVARCEMEAARSLVGIAYTYRLIDVEDFQTINRMFNKFGLSDQEVKP